MPSNRLLIGTVLSLLAACLAVETASAALRPQSPRKVVSLNGTWQVEQGTMQERPAAFSHEAPVPGLVDMAKPAFTEVGKKSPQREAFWYRRAFTVDGAVSPITLLKLHKSRYGAKVWLNGQVVGEYLACFTPVYLDVQKQLQGNGRQNELVVRVGADRESLPADVPSGWDFEKYLYIPGIYDTVELILAAPPYIENVQTVPDVEAKTVRAVVEVDPRGQKGNLVLDARLTEAESGKEVAKHRVETWTSGSGVQKADFTLPIPHGRLWSPDDPFLYELHVSTPADAASVRFGLRSFRFDPVSKRAMLNGRPYYMRGTNVCVYRFFEDENRGDRPWREQWVRRLHQQFKTLHWDSIRYCIGFPPEMWYDVADELGFLIQDEFPIWLLGKAPENPTAEKIIPQYVDWMRERWNHPCVVIWDAQNESNTSESGRALQAVRHLDLSNRPWENGWSEPQAPNDCVESHPYLFIKGWQGKNFFKLAEMAKTSGVPKLNKRQQAIAVPIIINEYCWLWLNRDGTTTCLTTNIYENALGKNSTTQQRRTMHARYVAALTEFWRCHREAAGVLQFCGLGYSRSGDKPRPEGGATSDHFIDLEKLNFEPQIAEYVGESFNPLGLMLNYWAEEVPAGSRQQFEVYTVNDRYEDWRGEVRLRIVGGGKDISAAPKPCAVPALGRTIVVFDVELPKTPGACQLVAEVTDPVSGKKVRSLRDVKVK